MKGVYSKSVIAACWIGEDPDFDTCDTIVSWQFDKGTIEGVDVSGLTLAAVAHIPGNNLIGDGTGCAFVAAAGDLVGTSGSPVNPLLGALAANGGPTATMALLAGSSPEWRVCCSYARAGE